MILKGMRRSLHSHARRGECAVTFSDLCAGILKWVVDVHPFTISERKLARPIDLFLDGLDSCPAPMFVESYASLDVLAGVMASATVDQSGVVSHWIQYAGEDLRRLRNEIGTNFKTKYKFDPYDLGTMFVQHPKEGTWIYVPAKDQEYPSGLTLTQHRLIRGACKERLNRANAEQVLRTARLELQDHWSSAISAGKRLKRAHHLALSQNKNSVDILRPRTHTKPQDLCCCTEHEVCLIDQCVCGRSISWRRRSLLVCECGRMLLGSVRPTRPVTKGALAICRQIEYLLGKAHFRLQSPLDDDLTVFDDISVDTFLRLVWALGGSRRETGGGTPHILHAIPTPFEAMLTADHAYNRIRRLLSGRDIASLHRWLPQLISIEEETVTSLDQRLMSSILARIRPRAPAARRINRNGPRQSSLFEE